MFRCAKDGMINETFEHTGFRNINVKEVAGKLRSQTTDVYWNMMTEVGAPIVATLSKADEATKAKIKDEVNQTVQLKYPDSVVLIDSSSWVVYGEK